MRRRRNAGRTLRVVTHLLLLLPALLVWGILQPRSLRATPVTSPPRVLILDETVLNGATSQEALAAQAAIPGCVVDVVPAANWAAIPATGFSGPTGFGFDKYRAIIIGDPSCNSSAPGYIAALNALNATKAVWTPMVTGNVILEGVDNVYHYSALIGAAKTLDRGIAFAVNDPAKTGLYYALSCYYDYTAPAVTPTLVPHLTGFGTFMVRNYNYICFNDAHIVANHPVFTAAPALTDAELSNWSCSTHEGFDAWPPNFVVLAIALTNGTYNATDGSNGVPYILVRGEGVEVITTIGLGPPVATNDVGTTHTVCATLATNVNPRVGIAITFTISSGPNAVTNYTTFTDTNGTACFTYTGVGGVGTDFITASYFNEGSHSTNFSATVTKIWVAGSCLGVGCESTECYADGTWSYRFCVTNLGSAPISAVGLANPPAGVTFTPNIINFSPPLNPGQSTNVTVTVSAPVAAGTLCFEVGAVSFEGMPPCKIPHCLTLASCCNRVITNTLTYTGSSGVTNFYTYSITLQNITANPVKYVAFGADQSCVRFLPPMVDLTLPAYGGPSLLYPTQIRTISVQVQRVAPCPGTNTVYLSMLTTNLVACCSSKLQLPKPICIKIWTPVDRSVAIAGKAVSIVAVPINPCPFGTVLFYAGSTYLGLADHDPYSLDVTFTEPGIYDLTAVGVLSSGELETSDPVLLDVIIPGETHGQDPHTDPPTLSGTVVDSALTLTVPTLPGHDYSVEYRTNLTSGEWQTLEAFPGDGTAKAVSDAITNSGSRFYRSVRHH